MIIFGIVNMVKNMEKDKNNKTDIIIISEEEIEQRKAGIIDYNKNKEVKINE